jgi:molybdopterin-guanine dinucleotide biosynthesis protein A
VKRGAVVLCGGRSTRMGRDKASLPFGSETLLGRVARILLPVVEEVLVVGRRGQALPPLPDGVRVVHDDVEDQGPLGGLVPALRATSADAVYVTGCDVPFLEPAIVGFLFDRLDGHDVVVPRAEGFTQPLSAVYRAAVLPTLERLFAAGRRRPVHLFDEVDTSVVEEDALRAVDPELATLANLNTPEAYEAALARRAAEEGP